jgi:hypothetical protein
METSFEFQMKLLRVEDARQQKNSCKICSFIELLIRLLQLETNDFEDSTSLDFEGKKFSPFEFIVLKFLPAI